MKLNVRKSLFLNQVFLSNIVTSTYAKKMHKILVPTSFELKSNDSSQILSDLILEFVERPQVIKNVSE